ncbi:MAG: hypothetical protein ACSHW7_11045 [Patiriisocius sp.]|uniref:hypothetical protein n=1 Tax=Patiriisocius sp. TaxID=2822396 RepID=UPI003EF70AEC
MYRPLVILLTIISLISCKKEELVILEGETETSFVQDVELKNYISNIAAHDGTFDDIIDRSPCFSIDFPYAIFLNGDNHQINGVEDLRAITPTDEVTLSYPVAITFATYEQMIISSETDFNQIIDRCLMGSLYNESIRCVDILYPISVGVFNAETSDFETVIFDHDKKTFQSIAAFTSQTLASIRYPIDIVDDTGVLRRIESNDQFKVQVGALSILCD